ncbi:MAG: ABC transporter permease, partial [Chthoniobacteraceae bacterium]
MNLWLGLVIGLKEIWAHKFRSFLTMLGVILGVASLLAMFSLTAGMARGMREYMQQVGGIEKVEVVTQEVPPEQESIWEISPGRTVVDAEAIADTVGLVTYVSPVVELRTTVEVAGENFKTEVKGAWPDYMPINKHVVEFGRSLSQLDLDRAHHVCVIGRGAVERLWPDRPNFNAIGESILIQQRPFKIVGVFEFYEREEDKRRRELKLDQGAKDGGGKSRSNRWSPFYRKNTQIVIPITTMFYEFKSATLIGTTDTGPDY